MRNCPSPGVGTQSRACDSKGQFGEWSGQCPLACGWHRRNVSYCGGSDSTVPQVERRVVHVEGGLWLRPMGIVIRTLNCLSSRMARNVGTAKMERQHNVEVDTHARRARKKMPSVNPTPVRHGGSAQHAGPVRSALLAVATRGLIRRGLIFARRAPVRWAAAPGRG